VQLFPVSHYSTKYVPWFKQHKRASIGYSMATSIASTATAANSNYNVPVTGAVHFLHGCMYVQFRFRTDNDRPTWNQQTDQWQTARCVYMTEPATVVHSATVNKIRHCYAAYSI